MRFTSCSRERVSKAGFVSGHDFSRAEESWNTKGFNLCEIATGLPRTKPEMARKRGDRTK
jgi:hypothetical protein